MHPLIEGKSRKVKAFKKRKPLFLPIIAYTLFTTKLEIRSK
jgi:hypothetical protein